jgi:hypothetical protein
MTKFTFRFRAYGWPIVVIARLCSRGEWDSKPRETFWNVKRFGRWALAVKLEFEAVPVRENQAESNHHFSVAGEPLEVTVIDAPAEVVNALDLDAAWSKYTVDGRTYAVRLTTNAEPPPVRAKGHRALMAAD